MLPKVIENDELERLIEMNLLIDDLVQIKFSKDMNILNFAIDKESERILQYLAE